MNIIIHTVFIIFLVSCFNFEKTHSMLSRRLLQVITRKIITPTVATRTFSGQVFEDKLKVLFARLGQLKKDITVARGVKKEAEELLVRDGLNELNYKVLRAPIVITQQRDTIVKLVQEHNKLCQEYNLLAQEQDTGTFEQELIISDENTGK